MSCDLEPATIWRETVHKAAKEHTCVECRGKILKGERYTRVFVLGDGVEDECRCQDCVALICDLHRSFPNEDGCGMYLGGLHEELYQNKPGAWKAEWWGPEEGPTYEAHAKRVDTWNRLAGAFNACSANRGSTFRITTG